MGECAVSIRMIGLCAVVAAVFTAGLGLTPAPVRLAAQDTIPSAPTVRFSTGSAPATVTVGDGFRALVRVSSAPGARIEFAPAVGPSEAIQQTDSLRVLVGEGGEWTAVYPLVAWQTGLPSLPPVPVRVILPDGTEQRFEVGLRLPEVQSVLPADTAGIEPRPSKTIIADRWNRQFAVLLVLGLLFLLVGAVLLWRRHRRGRGGEAAMPVRAPRTPREEALARLGRVRDLPAARPAERKIFYSAVSDVLRRYVATLSPRWGVELTTAELLRELDAEGVGPDARAAFASLLTEADLVKFARWETTADDAEGARLRAREWVSGFPPLEPVTVGAGAERGGENAR